MDEFNETYSDGCELTDEGVVKNYSQYRVANDRKINKYLYLILWTNYVTLSVSHSCFSRKSLTNDFNAMIIGSNANDYMLRQLIIIWKSMHSELSLKHEEVEHIFNEVMSQFLSVSVYCKCIIFYCIFLIVFL